MSSLLRRLLDGPQPPALAPIPREEQERIQHESTHGRHCSCVEETRRPVCSLHAEDAPDLPADPFMRSVRVDAAVSRGKVGPSFVRRSRRYMPEAFR